MQSIANSRQGECLSTIYTNARTNILWKCSDGHTWAATPDNVKRGTWCPYCKNIILLNEEKCRYILEWFTAHKFPKTNRVLGGLQLDGYCAKLNVGFEYNGIQHYKYTKYFHKTTQGFSKQKIRDKKKRHRCKELGLNIIEVPYTIFKQDEEITFLHVHLISLLTNIRQINDFSYEGFQRGSYLQKCGNTAKNRGGRCLSETYLGSNKNMQWQCSEGHRWHASWDNIKANHWCPNCRNNLLSKKHRMYKHNDLVQIAAKKGGECLSLDKYKNCKTYLVWKCQSGHTWSDSLDHVVNSNRWCSKCKKKVTP